MVMGREEEDAAGRKKASLEFGPALFSPLFKHVRASGIASYEVRQTWGFSRYLSFDDLRPLRSVYSFQL